MSSDATSSEKVSQMPISNLNQSPISEPHSEAYQRRGVNHPLAAISPTVAPFIWIFLFASIGVASDKRLKELLSNDNETEWKDFRNAIVTRVNNINIIASLFIAGAAVFMSTVSPDKDILDWGNRVSFYAFGCTIGVAMLAIYIGCLISYIFMDLRTKNLRSGNSLWEKMAVILFFLWTHTVLLFMALALVIIAAFAAIWNGTSVLLRIGVTCFAFATVFHFALLIFLIFKMGNE